tara:strand:+ start:217 stop:507 length:291 start_codon:yes stop_codon:yes gene_type:complete
MSNSNFIGPLEERIFRIPRERWQERMEDGLEPYVSSWIKVADKVPEAVVKEAVGSVAGVSNRPNKVALVYDLMSEYFAGKGFTPDGEGNLVYQEFK